jgi:hypothetical protein
MLPENLHRYFWDHKPDDVDPSEHSAYIIERLLEHGNDEAVRWVIQTYPRNKVAEVVLNSKRISRKTGNFWADYFNLRKEEVFCLSKQSANHAWDHTERLPGK